jgi:hypothetical protein
MDAVNGLPTYATVAEVARNYSRWLSDNPGAPATWFEQFARECPGLTKLLQRVQFLFEARAVLSYIAAASQDDRIPSVGGLPAVLPTPALWGTNEKGLLTVGELPLVGLLTGIEASRIRRCEKCHNLFFARPSHKQGCSRECCHWINVRNLRIPEMRELYNKARRKKGRKAGSKQKEGR